MCLAGFLTGRKKHALGLERKSAVSECGAWSLSAHLCIIQNYGTYVVFLEAISVPPGKTECGVGSSGAGSRSSNAGMLVGQILPHS